MHREIASFLLAAAGLASVFAGYSSKSTPPSFSASCVAIDGDTLRCGDNRIRLLGIDAAELPGHCRKGRQCAPGDPVAQTQALADFVAAGPVIITPIKHDRYGRMVAVVTDQDGRNASCAAIDAGALYVAKWDHSLRIAGDCL